MYAWIDVASFTPWSALIGGLIIGLAAAVLIVGSGHIMGMSGILKSSIVQLPKLSWQLVFVIGMAVATWVYALVFGFPEIEMGQPIWKIIVAGLLVGFGTRLGGLDVRVGMVSAVFRDCLLVPSSLRFYFYRVVLPQRPFLRCCNHKH